MSGGSSELLEVQEKLQTLTTEYDRLNDEWTSKLADQQADFQKEKHALLQDSSARLQAAKQDAEAKNAQTIAELEKFRRAFTGDTLGWAAASDEKGKPYYYNSETGESDYDKPRILEIAEAMQSMDSLDEGKKKQERAIKKGREAELLARKLEVSLNELRVEAAALRKTKKEWEACGAVVTSICTAMSTGLDDTEVCVKKVESRVPVIKKAALAVNVATTKIGQLKARLQERDAIIAQLRQDVASAMVNAEKDRERADKLEARFTQAVEERVEEVKLPLEDQLAMAYAGRQEEKALRESDRRYLADLWPEGWLVPSMLRRFRTISAQERAEKTLRLEEAEAERDMVEAIRAGVAAAAKWEVKTDDYGRTYHANWETGEAVYDPPPEVGYRPPLGRNELGEKVDPRLQALREWEQGTDGWGKPYWQNSRSGDVVQTEPKGWSEAMELGKHEMEGWEGPTPGEVAKEVAVEAARVVVTWLNKAREAEEKRKRADAEPLAPEGDDGNGGDNPEGNGTEDDEDDEDQEEFVYDIQSVEELAMGDEGWRYQDVYDDRVERQGDTCKATDQGEKKRTVGVLELRNIIAKLARREDRFEKRLKQVRRNLEDLAHDLLAVKKEEELAKHGFAVGHSYMVDMKKEEGDDNTEQLARAEHETVTEHRTRSEGVITRAAGMTPTVNGGGSGSPSATAEAKEENSVEQGTQAAGEAATEAGNQSDRHQEAAKNNNAEKQLGDQKDNVHPRHPEKTDTRAAAVDCDVSNRRRLPDSLELEVGNRAFPFANEGIVCPAFHALAAEAVWTGLSDSGRVEKPLESIWDPRGGDRWGTAAFFAETLGEREEEAVPGLPQTKVLQVNREGGGDRGGGGHPLAGTSARHAAARVVCLAAVSSRRGFLQQATDTAVEEARQRMRTFAGNSAFAQSILGGNAPEETINADNNNARHKVSPGKNVGLQNAQRIDVGDDVESEKKCFGGSEDPVVRSPVMLEFGAEVPAHAASTCGRAVQLPVPDAWDEPEARENQHAAQAARRKETIETLHIKESAPLARPKGYNPPFEASQSGSTSFPRGYQDARELLRYEAVVLEELLHHTLIEAKETQEQLEATRVRATARWDQLVKAEKEVLKGLANQIPQQQSRLAKLSMEIRGLRVPLVEPHPPPPPTLDPGSMKPPSPVPDGQKLRRDELDDLVQSIGRGKYDHGEQVSLPEGKTISSKQAEEVAAAIHQRQEEVAVILEEQKSKYNEATAVYEEKHREWEGLEAERKERLITQCHESRLDHLNLDTLVGLKKSHEEHLALLLVEASAAENITAQSEEAKRRFEVILAKQVAEEARAYDWLIILQVELSNVLAEREALERLPDAALNRLDSLRWEQRRLDKTVECRRRVAELREALVEEGRRRRLLYEEKRWATQSELRRVLAEKMAVEEKDGMLRLLLAVGETTLASRSLMLNARKTEAAADNEGVGTEGTLSPGEVYSSKREWTSEEFRRADAELKAWEEKLAEMLHIRKLARRRETTVGELVLGAARGALPPPHPDQWLPKAEQERHEDEARRMQHKFQRELLAKQEVVEEARVEVRGAVREATILKEKLQAVEGWRNHEILALRAAGRDAADNLKGLLDKQRQESAARIDKLECALSELRKEYNEVRADLTARIEQLSHGRSDTAAWIKALKHDLATERVKREVADERLAIVVDDAKVTSEKLRTELRAERMHSIRLELWIAALHDESRLQKAAQEELKRLQAIERKEHEKRVRQERHVVWRHKTAVRLLCTSVDSLFLFFAQRVANLAGSRRTHNDALRANGAIGVLAAVCRGPRKDLRRLATRALGALGWDGHTEERVLAWDIYRQWDLWVESCCPAEEERLRRRGRTFDDPEQFKHDDELVARASRPGKPAMSLDSKNVQKTNQQRPLGCLPVVPNGDAGSISGVGTPDGIATVGGGGKKNTYRSSDRSSSCNIETSTFNPLQQNGDAATKTLDALARTSCNSPEGPSRLLIAAAERHQSDGDTATHPEAEEVKNEEQDDDDDEDFKPTVTMNPRAVVRERRQWALRRARRREGPNEANQLELGGWSDDIFGEIPVAGATGEGADVNRERLDTAGGGGERSVVALLARLCQEQNDWETVRAAVSALSVAAYLEVNVARMSKAAPNLIRVLVGLLSHPDAEVQAHSATTLANLAHGCLAYQSEAGEAGAIKALLDICRGRARVGGESCCIEGGKKEAVNADNCGGGGNKNEAKAEDPLIGIEGGGLLPIMKPENDSDIRQVGVDGGEMLPATKKPQKISDSKEHAHKEEEGRTSEQRATKNRQGIERAAASAMISTDASAMEIAPRLHENEEGQYEDVGTDVGEKGEVADTMDVDAVQAATAALANLLCYSDANSMRLVAAGGIGVLVGLVSSYRPHNLLDFDQAEEIHANAAEALVNATRNHGEDAASRIHSLGISPLVLMCGSDNIQVKRHAALVLGNICQTDAHREIAGKEGAVEGLFALCDANDGVVQANALWALGNLAWDHCNQERIGRYASQLLDLASSSWLPVRTNALVCLGNSLFFHELNRRRVENIDGALLMLLGYCSEEHPAPIQESALRCLVSLTYVDRVVAPLAEAGCIVKFVASLAPSVSAAVRRPAALALLNVVVRDHYKAEAVKSGGVEAAVALLGSDDSEERELAARILGALASTEADEEEGGVIGGAQRELDMPHLLGIVQMHGNLPAQKAAAEQIADAVSKNPHKQASLGECGGVAVLLEVCAPKHKTEARLLVPVLWGLRNCLNDNAANKDRFVRAGGLEALVQLCDSSRSSGEWAVAETVLTTLVTAVLGNGKMCRRLLRVGLDQLIDAAEDHGNAQPECHDNMVCGATNLRQYSTVTTPRRGVSTGRSAKHLPSMPSASASRLRLAGPRGPAADGELGLDQIDEVGVDSVLQGRSDALTRSMTEESRETCSALATSLLQALGPFNYVVCGHCGSREKGGTTCSQCGYAITFDLGEKDEGRTLHPKGTKPLAAKAELMRAKGRLEI